MAEANLYAETHPSEEHDGLALLWQS